MSNTTCPPRTSFTVTIRCAMTPACAHRGAAATPEGSLGPVPSQPATCTDALSPASYLGGPRLASLVLQLSSGPVFATVKDWDTELDVALLELDHMPAG